MGRLTNLNPPTPIADSDLPGSIARDTEVTAAFATHLEAIHPHSQYKTIGSAETFEPGKKLYAISTFGISTPPNTFPMRSGLEIQAFNSTSGAHILFHRPGIAGIQFGLDTNNLLCVGGWSFGNNSFRIWTEQFGVPVWQAPSDPKLKQKIRPINSALAMILEAKPISFEYRSAIIGQWSESEYQRRKFHYGFNAEEFPISDLVSVKNNGYLGLDYLELTPFLVRAIQELDEKIQELDEKLKKS
jgi:hypothetical protein